MQPLRAPNPLSSLNLNSQNPNPLSLSAGAQNGGGHGFSDEFNFTCQKFFNLQTYANQLQM